MNTIKSRLALLAVAAVVGAMLAFAVVSVAAQGSAGDTTKPPPIVVPAVANMSSLSRPPTARDRAVAAGVASSVDALTDAAGAPPGMAPGTADMRRLRVLLNGLGSGRHFIYAVPTDAGRVCGGLTGGPSGCLEGFTAAGPVDYFLGDPDGIGSGEPAIVWGLAPDDVRAVHVLVGGVSYRAVMGRNAYFFELPSAALASTAVSGLVVDFADGRSQVVAVDAAGAVARRR